METQNITLSVPKNILRKVKLLAVRRQTSVSGLLTRVLEDIVDEETGYAQAKKHQLKLLEHGIDLGLHQSKSVSREELHDC